MFKRINWLVMLLVGAATLGVYRIIAFCRMTKQQNDMADGLGEKKVMGYLTAMLLGLVSCGIVPLIRTFAFCRQQSVLAQAKGIELYPSSGPLLLWLLCFVPVFRFYILCKNHNALCDVYEQ